MSAGAVNSAQRAFDRIASELLRKPGVSRSAKKGFGAGALTANGKIFATLRDDGLLLRLPRPKVESLISNGVGVTFDANKGRPMKEWVIVPVAHAQTWSALALEALAFVA